MTVKHWNTGVSADRYREDKRASEQIVTEDMVNYWLDDNYETWIAEILVSLVNDKNPNALLNLQKEIKDAWDQHLEQEINMINQERHNTILYLHSIWLRENGYKNWKGCERASKEEKRGSVSVPIAKQGSS